MSLSASRLQIWMALLAGLILCAPAAGASELVMFRSAGCPWCAAWDREVGPIYPKSEIGRRLPIRFVDLDRGGVSEFALKRPVRFTPTFVLLDRGREVGRIEGYPGADFFWGLLDGLAADQSAASVNDIAPKREGTRE